ncbi:protein kinase domain-containing protein [Novipirellula maiorica]|uniref:protein kinase domain-containing protein n=1 Tax=Novipirellula maiorica TaxID=1265734 RepID=UPI001360B14A|nr:protein kinase [Rhodopirellula maiorica]
MGVYPFGFYAPIVVTVAMASRRSTLVFGTATSIALATIGSSLVMRGFDLRLSGPSYLALACVVVLWLFRSWDVLQPAETQGKRKGPREAKRTDGPYRNVAVKIGSSKVDYKRSTAAPSTNGDEAIQSAPSPQSADDPSLTKVISKSLVERIVLERLRCSERFSRSQLALVEKEIADAMAQDSQMDWSINGLPRGAEIGEYIIDGLLSEGGAGQVYRAAPVSGGDFVAVKVLRDIHLSERFRREMELVGKLAHPNIVVAYEVGEHDGMLYIVMEQLAGPDLSVYVRLNGPLSWQDSVDVILQAARALEHAHQRGLVHRDVKPGNLVRDGDRRIKVTDLGLAVLTADRDVKKARDFRTGIEMVAGTLDFMAPEQARSLSSATELSDIYSLGATWFYLLTGGSRVPGESANEKLTSLLVDKAFQKLPTENLPDALPEVFERIVAYRPDDRYQSMAEVIAALESLRPSDATASAKHAVKVLVVEDNQDDLFLTVEMLRRMNKSIVVHKAFTLEHAIRERQSHESLDLVLLDLQLPDSSGVETVQQFRAAAPDVPIVVLTGQEDVQVGRECIEAGADNFASKNDLNAAFLERLIFITLSRCDRHES